MKTTFSRYKHLVQKKNPFSIAEEHWWQVQWSIVRIFQLLLTFPTPTLIDKDTPVTSRVIDLWYLATPSDILPLPREFLCLNMPYMYWIRYRRTRVPYHGENKGKGKGVTVMTSLTDTIDASYDMLRSFGWFYFDEFFTFSANLNVKMNFSFILGEPFCSMLHCPKGLAGSFSVWIIRLSLFVRKSVELTFEVLFHVWVEI